MRFKGNIKDYGLNPNLQELLRLLKKLRKILKTMVKREDDVDKLMMLLIMKVG
jgi:hypothetical protein